MKVIVVFALIIASAFALEPSEGFYVMAHMTNNHASSDWALSVGANALELDLQFSNNIPSVFQHQGVCDCLCSWIGDDESICDYVRCDTATSASTLLNYLASKPNLALVMIDSKVDFSDVNAQRLAGYEVTDLLVNELFELGFAGEVVVSVAKVDHFEYLYAVANSSEGTPYHDRFHFTFDGEENDINLNFQYMMRLPTMNRVFGTGNTACLPGDFKSAMHTAESNRKQGVSGLSYIWTMNIRDNMEDYLDISVGGIMTNYPQRARAAAVARGFTLATPATRIPAASSNAYDEICDCGFSITGCKVSVAAPKYTSCKCSIIVFDCKAEVVPCRDESSPFCLNPDTSVRACLEGRGNCGGHTEEDCECSYKRGGCVVSKAPPTNTACECKKTFLSCFGRNVLCNDENSQLCATPDKSRASCLLGSGNCGGY